MTSICIFNPKKFYEMLSSTQNINESLTTFRSRCQSNDIQYMFPAVNILQEVINSTHELPLTKYNALYTAQQMLMTLSYLSVFLVETYILPFLLPIARQFVARRSEQQLERYFVERGFRTSVGIKIVSKRYVQLAAQIIVAGANIKPSLNILQIEIQLPSKFQQAYHSLLREVKDSSNCFTANFESQRQRYLKNLNRFEPSNLCHFLFRTLKEEIMFNQGFTPAFKKLLQSEDFFISIPIINGCIHELSNLAKDFGHKRHFLSLFCLYIKQANIYAIVAAHNAHFVRQIFEEVFTVRGDISLSYGKLIFPEIEALHQQKLQFYCQFLRCLLLWGVCLQRNQIGEISELKQMYDYLSKDRQFQFPTIMMLQKIITDYAENLQANQIQNDQMLRLMDQNEHLLSRLQNLQVQEITIIGQPRVPQQQLLKTQHKLSLRQIARLKKMLQSGFNQRSNQSFEDLFNEVQANIKEILNQRQKIEERLNNLSIFQGEWPLLKKVNEQQLGSDIMKRGDELARKIVAIKQFYLRWLRKQISWRVFKQKVTLIIHPDKDSQSYIQKIKLLPFPKKSINSNTLSKKQEKDTSKMEVVELEYFSKIHSKHKKGNHLSGQKPQPQTDPFLLPNLLSNRSDTKKQQQNIVLTSNKVQVQKELRKKDINVDERKNGEASHRIHKKTGILSLNIQDKLESLVSKGQAMHTIEPVTHNDYGIQKLLIKRRQYLQESQQSKSNYSRTIKRQQIREIQSRILPSDLLDQMEKVQKMAQSDDIIANRAEQSILRKHSSLRSLLNKSSRRSKVSERSQFSGKFSSNSARSQKRTLLKESPQDKSVEVNLIYQLNHQSFDVSGQNRSNYTQQRSQPVQVTPKICNFQRLVYSITSRSIQAYKEYANRHNSKPKSLTKNASTQSSKSNNKSIIRKQFQRLRPKERNQRAYRIDQSQTNQVNRTETIILNSEPTLNNLKQSLNKASIMSAGLSAPDKFSSLFPIKFDRLIKNCLHSKGILLDTDLIEVGYVHYPKDQNLDFTLFITGKHNLKSVKLHLAGDQCLKMAIESTQFSQMIKNKQETVKILTSFTGLPYRLPQLKVTVEDYSHKKHSHTVLIPCTINKYTLFQPVLPNDHDIVAKYKSADKIKRCFGKMNKKMERKGNISKYLSLFGGWPGTNQYLSEFRYQKECCLLGMVKDEQGCWYLWGRTLGNPNTLQYLLSTFSFLLAE